MRTGHPPDRQLRIIGQRRSNADHDNIDQCTQSVQMFDACRTVDVLGMTGSCRDPAVERLADLAYNDEIVDHPVPQRSEQIRPGLRQGLLSSTKKLNKGFPCVGGAEFADGEIAKLRDRSHNWVLANLQCHYRPLDRKNPSDFCGNDSGLSVFYECAR
jgi:hypothetical protein